MEIRAESERTSSGRTLNISRGGLCANVDADIEIGTPVTASLTLVFSDDAFSEPLAVDGRVVWSTSFADHWQIGLSFSGLSEEQRAYLDVFIRYLVDQGV